MTHPQRPVIKTRATISPVPAILQLPISWLRAAVPLPNLLVVQLVETWQLHKERIGIIGFPGFVSQKESAVWA